MAIPRLTRKGCLPPGLHPASFEEIRRRFGGGTARRVELVLALEELVERGRRAGVERLVVNGSFVTSKPEPNDIDLVIRVGADFEARVSAADADAIWIVERSEEARPKMLDLYLARDLEQLRGWMRLFENDVWHGKKGLVEVL